MTKKSQRKSVEPISRDDIPRVTVTLTDETAWITRHGPSGEALLTYPARMQDISNAFNRFGACTGLLSADTLFWSSTGGVLRVGIWIEPGKHDILLRGKKLERLTLPLPGLVFIGEGCQYSVYAATQRPAETTDLLYHCPLPNVHENGQICQGNVKFPRCAPDAMTEAIRLFFGSEFNYDLAGKDLIDLLRSLNRRRAFPEKSLRRYGAIGDVIANKIESDDAPFGLDDDDGGGNVRFDDDVWGNEEEEEEEEEDED